MLGTGLLVESHAMAGNHSGTLSAYDDRLDQARTLRIAGGATLAGGALLVGAAILRWRFHLVETKVEVHASPGAVGITLERPW